MWCRPLSTCSRGHRPAHGLDLRLTAALAAAEGRLCRPVCLLQSGTASNGLEVPARRDGGYAKSGLRDTATSGSIRRLPPHDRSEQLIQAGWTTTVCYPAADLIQTCGETPCQVVMLPHDSTTETQHLVERQAGRRQLIR